MEKVLKFVDEWGNRIMLLLVIIVFMKTCTTNNRIDKLSKKVTENNDWFRSNFEMVLILKIYQLKQIWLN